MSTCGSTTARRSSPASCGCASCTRPGHTEDSISLVLPDRVLTGDTLLRLATGRTDLPTGNAEALYDSLFGKLLRLDDAVAVYPGTTTRTCR